MMNQILKQIPFFKKITRSIIMLLVVETLFVWFTIWKAGFIFTIWFLLIGILVGVSIMKKTPHNLTSPEMFTRLMGDKSALINTISHYLHLAAGILFIFPGFVSDIFALLLLIPFIRKFFAKHIESKIKPMIGSNFSSFSHIDISTFSKGPSFMNMQHLQQYDNQIEGDPFSTQQKKPKDSPKKPTIIDI